MITTATANHGVTFTNEHGRIQIAYLFSQGDLRTFVQTVITEDPNHTMVGQITKVDGGWHYGYLQGTGSDARIFQTTDALNQFIWSHHS